MIQCLWAIWSDAFNYLLGRYTTRIKLVEPAPPNTTVESWMLRPNTKLALLGTIPHTRNGDYNIIENKCKYVLEKYFGVEFTHGYVDWIINPVTKRKLQLDVYNTTIKLGRYVGLALEYQGPQHSVHPNYLKTTREEYLAQLNRDAVKRIACKDNNFQLIEIFHTVKVKDVPLVILNTLDRLGYSQQCVL